MGRVYWPNQAITRKVTDATGSVMYEVTIAIRDALGAEVKQFSATDRDDVEAANRAVKEMLEFLKNADNE